MILRALTLSLCLSASAAWAGDRVLAIGGSVTEIVYALGAGDRLVARDTTSSFPREAQELPDVGYMRALSPEGIISVAPDLIIAEEGSGPPEALEVLESASIPIVMVTDDPSVEGIRDKVTAIGAALDMPEEAAELNAVITSALEIALWRSSETPAAERKRVLFILSTQGGRILASGTQTGAAAIIEMAGGINAVDAYEGYKPLTDEAVIAAAPDVILMMDRGGDHSSSNADLFALPSLASTPAAQTQSVVRMDGLYLLGFGPRTAAAIRDLNQALYGS